MKDFHVRLGDFAAYSTLGQWVGALSGYYDALEEARATADKAAGFLREVGDGVRGCASVYTDFDQEIASDLSTIGIRAVS